MINEETLRPIKTVLINISKRFNRKDRNSVQFLLNNFSEKKVQSILEENAKTKSKASTEKLAYFYLRSGEPAKARYLLEKNGLDDSPYFIQTEIFEGVDISKIIDRLLKSNRKLSKRTVALLSKSVKSIEEKEKIKTAVLSTGSLTDEHSIWRLRIIGEASRRVGDYKEALEAYRRAFQFVSPTWINSLGDKNPEPKFGTFKTTGQFDLKKAWRALNDFRSLALPGWFIDAGTLLGFIREGTFLKHDYDMDISFINPDAFFQTRINLYLSPLFEVQPGRVKNVFKICHANGMDIDIFLYKRDGEKMVKESHVYRWVFDIFDLSERGFTDAVLPVPSDPDKHLKSIYGDWWVSRKDFDGRYDALNVSFPNIDELECVLLNKAIIALQKRDYILARKEIDMLKKIGRDCF